MFEKKGVVNLGLKDKNREEIELNVLSNKNPSVDEIITLLKKDKETCVVKKIIGNFGRNEFDVCVVVYDSKKAKDEIERPSRKERKKIAEEAKKEAGAAKSEGDKK